MSEVQFPEYRGYDELGNTVNLATVDRDSPILVALTVDVDDTTVLGEKRQTKYATTHRPRHVAPAGPDRWSAGYVTKSFAVQYTWS